MATTNREISEQEVRDRKTDAGEMDFQETSAQKIFVRRALADLASMDKRQYRLNLQFLESALDAVNGLPSPKKEETLVALLVLDAGHVVQRYPRVRLSGYRYDGHHT